MISSIYNELYYQYQNVGVNNNSNALGSFQLNADGTVAEQTEETTKLPPPKPISEEEYSSSDHMDMMRGGKTAPKLTQASTTSSIDTDGDGTISADEYEEMISQMGIPNAMSADDFFAQFDVNEDGEISQDEMPEPGSVAPVSISSTSSLASDESTEESPSSEYQQLLLKTLQAYQHHYESMFETVDGSLNQKQA